MTRTVRAIRESAWLVESDYDPMTFVNALRTFQGREWSLHIEGLNVEADIQRSYNVLQRASKLYLAPCIDVIDHQAMHYKYNFILDSSILDLLEDLAKRHYHAEYAAGIVVHTTHVLIEAAPFVDSPIRISKRLAPEEVQAFATNLGKTYESIAL